MAEHTDLGTTYTAWVASELAALWADQRFNYHVAVCVHPQLPSPHLGLVVYVATASLARLGTFVSHVSILPLGAAVEDAVRDAARTAAQAALAQRSTQLAEARADHNGRGPT